MLSRSFQPDGVPQKSELTNTRGLAITTYHHEDVQRQGELEFAHDIRDFLEEVGSFDGLECCRPSHLISDHMADQRRQDLQTQSGEEDGEEHCSERMMSVAGI